MSERDKYFPGCLISMMETFLLKGSNNYVTFTQMGLYLLGYKKDGLSKNSNTN